MTMTEFLDRVNADRDMRKWCEGKTPEQAWRECHDGGWMLWVAARLLPKKIVVKASCAVARQALVYVPEGEDRPRVCIETTEAWVRGEATLEQVGAARKACRAYAAAAAAAYAAAYAAADAADDAYAAAADAAYAAAYAAAADAADAASADDAYAAAAAAADAASAAYATIAAREKSLSDSADIVRRHITWERIEKALEEKK